MKTDWSKILKSNLEDYKIDNYSIKDYSKKYEYDKYVGNWDKYSDNDRYIKKEKDYDTFKKKIYDDYLEDLIKKATSDKWTYPTHVETDEEKLEKMDIKTIEKFLRKKKLAQLPKPDES